MATKTLQVPDNRKDLLYVKKVLGDEVTYCGYKREYLVRNLGGMKEDLLVCDVCTGIKRNATNCYGVITCSMCSEEPDDICIYDTIQDKVNQLKIKCPLLRDCKWEGKLFEAERHLDNCQSFLIKCTLCKVVIPRGEYNDHEASSCPERTKETECVHCHKRGKKEELRDHYEYCLEYPISCPNQCGEKLPQKMLLKHRKKCQYEIVSCPYVIFGCETDQMSRKHLVAHKQQFLFEHQDMSLQQIKELTKENNMLKKKQEELEWEGKTMKQLEGVEWYFEDLLETITPGQTVGGPTFYIHDYKLRVFLTCEYNGRENKFQFIIERIQGEFDSSLRQASITEYRMTVVKGLVEMDCYSKNGSLDYELVIGKRSKRFGVIRTMSNIGLMTPIYYSEADTQVILYFEVSSRPPMTILDAYKPKYKLPTITLDMRDPFFSNNREDVSYSGSSSD